MKSAALIFAATVFIGIMSGADEKGVGRTVIDDAQVALTGELRLVVAYGPPNYGEEPATDSREDYLALVNFGTLLPKSGNGYAEDIPTTIVQLVFADGKLGATERTKSMRAAVNQFVGSPQRVLIKGRTMLAASPHHHERILVWVDEVSKAAP